MSHDTLFLDPNAAQSLWPQPRSATDIPPSPPRLGETAVAKKEDQELLGVLEAGFLKRGFGSQGGSGARILFPLGAATALYAFVDWTLTDVPQDSPYRAPAFLALSAILYQGLYYTSELTNMGFVARPDWRALGRAMPYLAVTQLGATHLWDSLGLDAESRENQLASFITSIGIYYGAKYLAARFPQLASTLTQGSGVGGKLFRGIGRFGSLLLATAAISAILDITGTQIGTNEDPSMQLLKQAWDQDIHDRWWYVGDLFNPLIKFSGAILMALSDDAETEYRRLHHEVIRGWIDDAGRIANQFDSHLTHQALLSLREGQGGDLEMDWANFEARIPKLFDSISERDLSEFYDRIRLLDRSVWVHDDTLRGAPIKRAVRMTRMIAPDGTLRDRNDLRRHAVELANAYIGRNLQNGFSRVGINKRDLTTSQLTPEQRNFLYAPETRTMVRWAFKLSQMRIRRPRTVGIPEQPL